jgi:hypothetical protein
MPNAARRMPCERYRQTQKLVFHPTMQNASSDAHQRSSVA